MRRRERDKRKFKKRRIWYVVIILVFAGYVSLAYLATPTFVPFTQEVGIEHQNVSIRWPERGTAAIGSLDGVRSLASIHGDTQVPTASTIKLLTALVVLEQKPLGPNETGEDIYFGAEDTERLRIVESQGGVVLEIPRDSTITYREALDATLVMSANNIADKLAIWAFGSIDAYTKAAKVYTVTHGLNQTLVTDASGLASSTVTSAMDMIEIARLAASSPVIAAISKQQQVVLASGRVITNTNDLLASGVAIGLKTGHTNEGGYCMVASKTLRLYGRDKTLLVAVFGQATREEANTISSQLLEDAASGFSQVSVVSKNQAVAYMKAPWGAKVEVKPKANVLIVKWKGEGVSATEDLTTRSHGKAGEAVGNLRIGRESFELVLAEDLPTPSITWRMLHAFDFIREKL